MPSFRAQTDLVTVRFQVRRGSGAAELKPEDVVLLEDGVPRDFTVFEAPAVHPTLDLALMFDVSKSPSNSKTPSVWVWDARALQDLAGYWSEAIARRLLDEKGATIRFSIYRFDQNKLQRLCRSTSNPKVLSDALHALPAGQGEDLPLPAGLTIRARERTAEAKGFPPQPWSLAGALSVLRDPDADKAAARALVVLSAGAEGSTLTPEDLADQAVAAGVPIYPVAFYSFPPILPYEGYGLDGLIYYNDEYTGRSMGGPAGPYSWMFGPADLPDLPAGAPPVAPYLNYPFELLGDLTSGLHFESVNHSQPLGKSGQRFVFDRTTSPVFSMNGAETENVLERVKKHALARFSSTYMVGFMPAHSDAPREHRLEVKLAPKSRGKIADGKRSASY